MLTKRASGILLHPTSLPGKFGAGDLGADAYQFVDWLKSAGQTYWQILPLGEIGPGNSPYMSSSAFAGNILLIDIAELAGQGWLDQDDLIPHPEFRSDKIDFGLLRSFRMERLRRAAVRFFALGNETMRKAYDEFCRAESEWLEDYALFMTIAQHQNWLEWSYWPAELAHRHPDALRSMAKDSADEVGFWKFCQWCFSRQWLGLKKYANAHGIRIIGDVPIFVAYQSADVWAHQELFELDENGRPSIVAGVPPDYFSETGQFWGNPLYRWDMHETNGYAWWVARLRHALKFADLVRIDHFRGFAACWGIPANAPNAIGGKWVPGPGEKLFNALKKAIPQLPIIAEDLGLITPDVIELRDRFKLPGMRILQFAFSEGEGHHFLPHHYVPNAVAYTGTHDNDTALGWWNSVSDREKTFAQHYLKSDGQAIHWDMMRALSNSAANTVVYPMQDVLGLSSEHRMNFPGEPSGNWEWRFSWDQVRPEFTQTLAKMSADHNRLCQLF
ncbi:4-alpha-glucanotransferase [Ferrigenium kumadai]|uniref:4-alpha-glucanotransferase n=1 Tax=Ferrigenium kumadai TaxID=1682490 RepID=A0AAN1SYS9_9PROT|nr:4-alpha-glucanotransferase [Ferrigenium kumadai]BBI99565.1 4-alpha-glucanotransferase [Ferrigenium kumadai]